MTQEELLKIKEQQLRYWQEIARNKTKEAGRAVRMADKLEREVYNLKNSKKPCV